jgi:hypothetical protein
MKLWQIIVRENNVTYKYREKQNSIKYRGKQNSMFAG